MVAGVMVVGVMVAAEVLFHGEEIRELLERQSPRSVEVEMLFDILIIKK